MVGIGVRLFEAVDRDHFEWFTASLGGVHWGLALCLLLVWVVCYVCVCKGVKYIGKVMYFTVAFPFLLLFILFFRGVTLPGAWDGIREHMFPDLNALAYEDTWSFAVAEVLCSFSACQGVFTTIGSYNSYKYNCYNDCLLLCGLNIVSRILTGFVILFLLGFGAHSTNLSVNDFIDCDIHFVSIPRALSLLPAPQFWSVIFFLMVFFFYLNTQLFLVESLVTTIMDIFPGKLRKPGRREVLVLVMVVLCLLLGLPLVTKEGYRVFHMIATYGLSEICLMPIICLEIITIGWIYGANRFYDNIEDMIGHQPYPVIKYCWLFVIPLSCVACVIYGMISGGLDFGNNDKAFASLMLAPILSIPVFILFSICQHDGVITTPAGDLKQACPHKPRLSLCKRVILAGHKSDGERADKEMPAADSTSGV